MGLFRVVDNSLTPLDVARFADHDIREREDLQRMLRESIEVIMPGALVLAEEFSDWEDSRRRLDLLCLDEDANLVVVELKRTEDGGHMDLQSIRYAAMVSQMTFDRAVRAHERYLAANGVESEHAEEHILEYLGWDEPDEDQFASDVRIMLVAADFSTEITTSVLWLRDRGIDIRCSRCFPYRLDDELLISVEQLIPLPSAEEYQVRAREKSIGVRRAKLEQREFTGYWFVNVGELRTGHRNHRSWEDSRAHGFIGGSHNSVRQLAKLEPGDRLFAYVNGYGYVGAGIVTRSLVPWDDFRTDRGEALNELPLKGEPTPNATSPEKDEHCVGVRWLASVDRDDAVKAAARRATACKLREKSLVEELLAAFNIPTDHWEK